VQHFDHYKLPKSKLRNESLRPVSGSVQFRPEQISALTDSVPEQWQPDQTITSHVTYNNSGSKFTNNLRTILRHFRTWRQSYDNWPIHRTFTTIL